MAVEMINMIIPADLMASALIGIISRSPEFHLPVDKKADEDR
jgi:hypothetical protein